MEKQKTLQYTLSLTLLIGVVTELFLLFSPSESRNSFVLGYSLTRLGMLAIVALVSLASSWILWKATHDNLWLQGTSDSFQSNKIFIPAIFMAGFGILISFNFFTIPAYEVAKDLIRSYDFIYLRLVPLMLWSGAVSALGMIALLILRHTSEETQKLSKHYLRQSIYLSAWILFVLEYFISIYWGWLGASN